MGVFKWGRGKEEGDGGVEGLKMVMMGCWGEWERGRGVGGVEKMMRIRWKGEEGGDKRGGRGEKSDTGDFIVGFEKGKVDKEGQKR